MWGSTLFGNSDRDMVEEHIDPLSKTTTYKTLCDMVQLKMKLFHIPMSVILRESIYGVLDLYSLKKDRHFYQKRKEFAIYGSSNPYTADMSTIIASKKIAVKYLWGTDYHYSQPVKELSANELENISQLSTLNSHSIYYFDRTDNIELYFGSHYENIIDGVIQILFVRQPNIGNITLANYSTEYVDALDTDIMDLANLICYRLRN